MTASDFLPRPARIVDIVPESADTRTFILRIERPGEALDRARAGQFVMLSILGQGEAAFSLSALPPAGAGRGTVELTVRRVGSLTAALFTLERGARVGLRGPFGRGFPEKPREPTLFVAGGCGLSPLKAAIAAQLAARPAGVPLGIVYGARDPEARIHRPALAAWRRMPDVQLLECVERAGPGWRGRTGLVIDHVAEVVRQVGARRAAACGPPAMLVGVAERLVQEGLEAGQIYLAIERYMKCGIGLCGHCYVNDRYVCREGPVFTWAELRRLPDAFMTEALATAATPEPC